MYVSKINSYFNFKIREWIFFESKTQRFVLQRDE